MAKQQREAPIVSGKDAITTAATAGAAITQVVTVSPDASQPVVVAAALLVALFPQVIAAFSEVAMRRMRKRADLFYRSIVDRWARDANITEAEVAGLLEAHKEDPNIADAVWRAVRELMEAPSDDAAIPLGVIAADYARSGRAADSFFRGVVRLLSELSSLEMSELRELLNWLHNKTASERFDVVARNLEIASSDRESWKEVPWSVSLHNRASGSEKEVRFPGKLSDAGRLIVLLKANGLATESGMSFWDYNPPSAELQRGIVERLIGLLGAK